MTDEAGPCHPHTALVNAMVEEGFDPDGAAYGDIAKFVLDTLDQAGYALTRCTCGNEGRHGRFHPSECQTNKDWLALLTAQKAGQQPPDGQAH